MRSQALEEQLRRHQSDPMVAEVLRLGLCVTPGHHQLVERPPAPPEDGAPSASLPHRKAPATPAHPWPDPRGGLPWAQQPASSCPQSCHRISPRSTARYESDLKELYGAEEWVAKAEAARTPATAAYVAELQTAPPVSLVAAAFIIYGALVVGGGKQTQLKARQLPPKG